MHQRLYSRIAGGLLLCALLTGCAGRGAPAPTSDPGSLAAIGALRGHDGTLSAYMARMRALSVEAKAVSEGTATVEASDPRLRDALASFRRDPQPATARSVAAVYAHLGIFDRAHQYYMQALTMYGEDAATYDGLARLWRDSGYPHVALADSYRAVFYAPHSPVARNTLGTILQALGHRAAARTEYERALQLDPAASYALNNLCYGWLLDGNAPRAISACREALRLEPAMQSARNNLALAHASAGDLEAARAAFAESADDAAALYNTGIVHLARHEYEEAVLAFVAAHRLKPSLRSAMPRARQAAARIGTTYEE